MSQPLPWPCGQTMVRISLAHQRERGGYPRVGTTPGKQDNTTVTESTFSGERVGAARGSEQCTPEPSSRCSGGCSSQQDSCWDAGSHLGVQGGLITCSQQHRQMLPVHLRARLWV